LAKLKIYTDENVDIRVAEGLRRRGIEAASAHEEGCLGVEDEEHFARAAALKAAIFTHDHHFVEIAMKKTQQGKEHYGVIFEEMHRASLGECIRRLALYADVLSAEEMMNVVEFL
jgi:predicted nuclease of predicted toxin-antitoxin system